MASFDDPSWPRRAAWPPAGDPGEPGEHDDGFPPPAPAAPGPPGDGGDPWERKEPKRRNLIWRWRRVFFLLGLLGMAGLAGVVAMMARTDLPELDELRQTSFVCPVGVAEGQCNSHSAMAQLSSEENRENVRLGDVPDHLVDAVVAAEDRDFYEHTGIDPVGITRALYHDVKSGGFGQGGSTITQQLVKNRYLTAQRSLGRKVEEALLAIRVEQEMSKREILEAYLNTIYLGRNAYGVQAASRAYFDRDVRDLDVGQAAYLAGLIRAPELADAERDPQEAERRRRTVLDAMLEEGHIDEQQHRWFDALPMPVDPQSPFGLVGRSRFRISTTLWPGGDEKGAQYVNSYVNSEANRILRESLGYDQQQAERLIANGGLRIYTTVDLNLQAAAYDAVYNTLDRPEDPAGALVTLNRQGQVVAMVGGRASSPEQQTQFVNYATAGRPVGSTFKPIALAEAVARGTSLTRSRLPAPGTAVISSEIPGCAESWEVSNYNAEDAQASTSFNLVDATKHSSNTAYGHLMAELTPESVKRMAQKLGMDSELDNCLPTVLGADNSTPLEMAEVYSTFATRGVHREPTVITRIEQVDDSSEVELLYEAQPQETPVLSEEQADLINHTLQQVVEGGTGTRADLGDRPVAGKTGTTSSNRDAWFVGYTAGEEGLTTSVWMGYPNPECPDIDPETGEVDIDETTGQPQMVTCPMNGDGKPVHGLASVTGGSLPAEIFKRFMQAALEQRPVEPFVEPPPETLGQGNRLGGDGGYDSGEGETEPSMPTEPGPGGGPPPSDPNVTFTIPGGGGGRPTTSSTSTTSTTDPTNTTEPPFPTLPGPTTTRRGGNP